MYYELNGGNVVGDRLCGTLLGDGEWALIGPDGYRKFVERRTARTV